MFVTFDHLHPLHSLSHAMTLATTNLFSISMKFFLLFSMCKWDHMVFAFFCLILLSILTFRCIHIVTNGRISFLWLNNNLLYIYVHNFLFLFFFCTAWGKKRWGSLNIVFERFSRLLYIADNTRSLHFIVRIYCNVLIHIVERYLSFFKYEAPTDTLAAKVYTFWCTHVALSSVYL